LASTTPLLVVIPIRGDACPKSADASDADGSGFGCGVRLAACAAARADRSAATVSSESLPAAE